MKRESMNAESVRERCTPPPMCGGLIEARTASPVRWRGRASTPPPMCGGLIEAMEAGDAGRENIPRYPPAYVRGPH